LADPSHPLIKNATAPSSGLPPRKGKRPLRAIVATSATSGVLGIPQPPKAEKRGMHRRIKSDVPRVQVSGIITKSDLLKNLPDPRWGGIKNHKRNRSRSGGELLGSGFNSYGSLGLSTPEKGNMHVRTKSDMSLSSAVTDLTKSALIKEVTEEGMILVSFNVV